MKKILNKVRWNIVEALKGEEKVPEKAVVKERIK